MVILGWGGVGWGNDVHVNLPTHVMLRYCYVLLHLHTHVMLRYGDLLLHLLTHVMLRYGDLLLHLLTHGDLLLHLHTHTSCYVMVVLGWGWVGWGNNVHVNLHTHVMLRYCYVLLHLHTHVMLRYGDLLLHLLTHVMLRYGDLLLHLLTHVMLRYGDLLLHLHTHTRHAHHCFCRWKPCLGVTCQKFENQTCQSVSSKQRMEQTNAKNLLFFPVHCGRDANRWQMVERPFQDGCMMESTQKNTLNWKSLSWVTVGENLWDHWHLTGFSKNFARPSKQWSASEKKEKKCCIPKKHELMSKNEVVLEIFNTLFFTSTWEKMTFRCRENDIFIDEKLLKPYGRLWVGNHVVI